MSIVDRIAQGVKDNAKRVERMTSRRTAPEDGEEKSTSSQRRIEKLDQERRVRMGIAEPEPMDVALPPVPLADPEVRASVAVDFLKAEVNILRGEVERLKESNPEGIPPPTPEGPANVRWTSTDTYNGPFALAERTNGSIMCLAGAVHAPGGVYEWTDETEVTISENEYAVITFTLTGSGAVYSAVLSAKATLATLVDTATTCYVVIGKKVGTGYGHLQWQYGNIFLRSDDGARYGATAQLFGAGSSSAGALNFTLEQNSNSAIVEASHAADTITIKRTAWYTVSIGARFRVSLGAAAYRGHSQVVVQLDTGAGPVDTVLLIEFCVQHLATAPIGSPTPLAFVTVSRQLDIQLSKDDVITATAPYNDNAEYAYCRLTVRHIHD